MKIVGLIKEAQSLKEEIEQFLGDEGVRHIHFLKNGDQRLSTTAAAIMKGWERMEYSFVAHDLSNLMIDKKVSFFNHVKEETGHVDEKGRPVKYVGKNPFTLEDYKRCWETLFGRKPNKGTPDGTMGIVQRIHKFVDSWIEDEGILDDNQVKTAYADRINLDMDADEVFDSVMSMAKVNRRESKALKLLTQTYTRWDGRHTMVGVGASVKYQDPAFIEKSVNPPAPEVDEPIFDKKMGTLGKSVNTKSLIDLKRMILEGDENADRLLDLILG